MGYVVSQVFGALAAAFALYGLSKSFDAQVISQYQSYGYDLVGLGTNGYADTSAFLKINVWGAFVTELLLTFVFVLAFLSVTAKTAYKNVAGLVAGMAFCMAELFGLVLTGAGINPAKSFGTAFVKAVFGDVKALSQVWDFAAFIFTESQEKRFPGRKPMKKKRWSFWKKKKRQNNTDG